MSEPTNPQGPFGPQPEYPAAPPSAPTGPWPASGAFGSPPPAGAYGTQPPGPSGPPPAPGYEMPAPTAEAPAGPPRSKGAKTAVAAGAVFLVGGLAFLAFSLRGGGDTGSATPEEAGQALLDAVENEDLIGVFELLPPGERDLFRDTAEEISAEGRRLGLLDDGFGLDGIDGIEIDITGTAIDRDSDVRAITDGDGPDDGIAIVTVDEGEVELTLDGSAVEGSVGGVAQALIDELGGEIDVPDEQQTIDFGDESLSFAVVEEDGRWHPSLIASGVVLGAGVDIDLADPDVEARGAADPLAAVQVLVDAATALDARAALAVLDPAEARLFQAAADGFGVPEGSEDTGITAEITDAEIDDLGNGVRRVIPTAFSVSGEIDGGTIDVSFDGDCFRADIEPPEGEGDPIHEEVCVGDDPLGQLPDEVRDALDDVEIPPEFEEIVDAFQPIRVGIITVERDGEHFVSPLRTGFDIPLGLFVRGVEPEDIQEGGILFRLASGDLNDEFEELGEALDDAIGDAIFGDFEDFGDEFPTEFPDETTIPDDESTIPEEETFPDEETFPEETIPERTPTGASGPNGEVLIGDVVEGSVDQDGTATFTAVGVGRDVLIGAQGLAGFDGVLTIIDPATGDELASNDDHLGFDPEVSVELAEGQVVTIEIAGFSGDPGDFLLYYEESE